MTRRALRAYGQAALENEVDAASPHKLIALLYDGALRAIAQAKRHLERGEIAEKCEAITRALAIIDQGLLSSVDEETGGEIAVNLSHLYQYMIVRLALANAKNDPAMLEEVERLIGELSTAWSELPHVSP